MFTEKAFKLLAALEADNSKQWFDEHRTEMRDVVQQPFAAVLEAVTERLADSPIPLKGSEQTMFRMNRDVRFSKDKAPYNASVSGVLTHGGTKKEDDGVTYLHLDARGGFMASGLYNLPPKELGPIRDRMVERLDEFEAAVAAIDKAGFALSHDDALTGMPAGYAQYADAPCAQYLKLKSILVRVDLTKSVWQSGEVVEQAAALTEAASGLIAFGRAAR